MSNESPLLLERQGNIAVLTINRPQTRNALSGEDVFAAFETRFADLNADKGIRVAILTGSGTAFCSGGNVTEMRDKTGKAIDHGKYLVIWRNQDGQWHLHRDIFTSSVAPAK